MSNPIEEAYLASTNYRASPGQILFAEPELDRTRRTYIIMGNGRGGTSMVAGMVVAMNCCHMMPESEASLNFEDVELVNVAQGKALDETPLVLSDSDRIVRLRELLEDRAAANDVWGWKDPSADLYLADILEVLPNPHFVFVWRDVAAVAGAHVSIGGISSLDAFRHVIDRYNRYWELLDRLRRPTLMVSYERARQRPMELLELLGSFYGAPLDFEISQAVSRFVASEGGYRPLVR